jgi:site-specific recombinase XerD
MPKAKNNKIGKIQIGPGTTGNEKLTGITEDFLRVLSARKLAIGSIEKRRDSLRKFLLYLERIGIKRFQDVDLKVLETFRLCLIEHSYSAYTIEGDIRAVQLFFRFLSQKNILFDNPAEQMRIPKAPVVLGTVLTEKEIQELLSVPNITTARGLRDRALLETLYSTGMRRGEAAGLSICDVNLDSATVRVKGKFGKQRLLPLGKHAVKFLRLYLQDCRQKFMPKFATAPDELWLNHKRQQMSTESIGEVISKCAKRAGLVVSTHTLRRSCATHMLRGGAHPVAVAKLLGHSGLQSLVYYLQTTITDLMKAHAQTNPGK